MNRVISGLSRTRLSCLACGFVLAVGWMLVAGWARGEDFQIRSWHVEDGLPDGNVTALAQTPDGCLWVGTQAGLARFDGADFTRIDGLADPVIAGLLVDRGGALWIVGRSGTVVRRMGARMVVVHAAERSQPAGDGDAEAATVEPLWHAFSPLAMDAAGAVWLLHTDRECLRFHENGAAETVPLEGLPAGAVRGIMADFKGRIGLLKGDRVFGFDAGQWFELAGSGDVSRLHDVVCPARGSGLWVIAETAGSAAAGLRCLGGECRTRHRPHRSALGSLRCRGRDVVRRALRWLVPLAGRATPTFHASRRAGGRFDHRDHPRCPRRVVVQFEQRDFRLCTGELARPRPRWSAVVVLALDHCGREQEILASLAKGHSYKEIATDCGISGDTVRKHMARIYEKLHVHSRTEAILKFLGK